MVVVLWFKNRPESYIVEKVFMKSQRNSSIDGFVPRRAGSRLGDQHAGKSGDIKRRQPAPVPTGMRRPGQASVAATTPLTYSDRGLSRRDIDESLNSINVPAAEAPKKNKWRFGKKRGQAPVLKKRRVTKWVIIAIIAILVLIGGWLAYKTLNASNHIFKGNIFGLVQSQSLKQDANGRSNILVLGTSEDDPGHGGAYLTDSMMVVSIDQKNKTASMFSITLA